MYKCDLSPHKLSLNHVGDYYKIYRSNVFKLQSSVISFNCAILSFVNCQVEANKCAAAY